MTRVLFRLLATMAVTMALQACDLQSKPFPAATGAAPAASAMPTEGEACSLEYYPVEPGATWTYSLTGGVTGTFTRTITALTPKGFTDQDVFSAGVTRTGEWECEDGIMALQPDAGISGAVQAKSLNAKFHTTDNSGVTIPDNLGPGATWNQEVTLEGTVTVNGQDIPARNELTMECSAGSTESVTVPAGTFDALRTECKYEQKITITMGSSTVPTDITSTAVVWYAPNVGMIKNQENVANGPSVSSELTTYKIP